MLPDDLKSHFENGQILVTAGDDLYKLTDGEVKTITNSSDPKALMTVVEGKLNRPLVEDSSYYLLYYGDFRDNETGRTGVVMKTVDGAIKPLIIKVGDREFVVEVKGCGTKTGGFGKMHFRTGHDIITGGAEREQASNEFYRLQDDDRKDAPKAVGSILFNNRVNNSDYPQGYIIRLTPSTVRASFSDNECYPNIADPEMVKRILEMYTSQLADQIFSPKPKILDRSSHTENLLIWGDGQYAFTDFSDHIAFDDKHYPHEENHGGYMTPKQMLKYYVQMVKEIPGYTADRDQGSYHDFLTKALNKHDIDLALTPGDDQEAITRKIWEKCMAYQVFAARKEGRYIAEGVLNEFNESASLDFHRRDLSLESPDEFAKKFDDAKKEIEAVMDSVKSKLNAEQQKTINQWLGSIASGDLFDALDKLNDTYQIGMNLDSLSEDEKTRFYRAISYFSTLDYVMLGPIQKYLEHERDVVTSAKLGCPEDAKEDLDRAEEELRAKVDHIRNVVNGSLQNFYDTMTNPDEVKRLITFTFYGHQQ